MSLWKWLRSAASNGTADPSINYQEGQAPATLNDAGRAVMAAVAKYRDDVSGATVTSGTAAAYSLSTYQAFDTLAHLNGNMLAFTPNVTNVAAVTLNVDGLGAKPLRGTPGADLIAGVLVAGTPYTATYYSASNEFILAGFFNSPYAVPVSGAVIYFGHTAPNSCFALPLGQAISRTAFPTLYNLIGTEHGAGDGTATFNLPDLRGRLPAFWDSMGGTPAGRLTFAASGIDGTTIGARGGAQTRTLTGTELPAHNHTGSVGFTSTGTATGTAAGTASGSGSGTASISGNAAGSGSLTATTAGVLARGSGTLTGSGTAAASGTLTGSGTSGAMDSGANHAHAIDSATGFFNTTVNNGSLTPQSVLTTVGGAVTGRSSSSTNIDHRHAVSVSVPYNLSMGVSSSVPYDLALALDAISVPYSLSLPYSASATVNSTVSATFSVAVNSSVSVSGSSGFTTNNTGSGGAFSTAQPTIVVNCIIRII